MRVAKPVKRVDVSKLTPEQLAALGDFIRRAKAAAPQVDEIRRTAQAMFEYLVKSPEWRIAEAPPPGEKPRQSLWHVGAPEVNYVDHIEEIKES